MVRTLLFGLWGCVVTSGTLFLDLGAMSSSEAVPKMVQVKELPPVFSEPKTMIAPVVVNTEVSGFLFSNIVLEMDAKASAKLSIPLNILLEDSYMSLLVGNPEFLFPRVEKFDALRFKEGLKVVINGTAEMPLVRSVYVSDVNFLGKGEARTKQRLRSVWLQERTRIAEEPKSKKSKSKKDP